MLDYGSLSMGIGVAAIIICVTDLLYTFVQGRTSRTQNKLFIAMVLILLMNSISVVICEICMPNLLTSSTAFTVNTYAQYLYFCTHNAICPILFCYVNVVNGAALREKIGKNYIYGALFALAQIFLIINPIFHCTFYYDENGVFQRNWGEAVFYFVAVFFLVRAFLTLIYSWDYMTAKRKSSLVCFFIYVIIGVIIQLVNKGIKSEVFFEALGLTGIMLEVENEGDRINASSGFYNRDALRSDINGYIINKRPAHVIGIRITNSDIIEKYMGSEKSGFFARLVSELFLSVAPRHHIFDVNSSTFAITFPSHSAEQVRDKTEKLSRRFEEPFESEDGSFLLDAVIMCAELPDMYKTATEVLYMFDAPLSESNDKKILKGSDLDYLVRRSAVENALSRGLEKGSFEVYYQPTFCIDCTLHGAEALLRMNDSELGMIYPDEFIPIAEQMGLIDRIDDFVLKEVCALIESGVVHETGMAGINVNLSVRECMKPDFVEHIIKLVNETGVSKGHINFEVTESVAADDYMHLGEVVTRLKDEGFHFAMDDYGTGYSNINSIFSIDFDVVKIDKSILWGAKENNSLGYIILENSIRMISQMNKKILVEGVETAEQVELLKKLGVDYLQGFYFSKPLPKNKFIEFISSNSTYDNSGL